MLEMNSIVINWWFLMFFIYFLYIMVEILTFCEVGFTKTKKSKISRITLSWLLFQFSCGLVSPYVHHYRWRSILCYNSTVYTIFKFDILFDFTVHSSWHVLLWIWCWTELWDILYPVPDCFWKWINSKFQCSW